MSVCVHHECVRVCGGRSGRMSSTLATCILCFESGTVISNQLESGHVCTISAHMSSMAHSKASHHARQQCTWERA